MTQKEQIKVLEQFAKQKNIPFYSCSQKKYNVPNVALRYIASRYVIYDLSKIYKGLYFIFYDSSTGGTYNSSGWGDTYCGLFMEITDFNYNVTIKERQWFDKFSFQKRYLTGNANLDKRISIHTDSRKIDHTFFRERKVHYLNDMMKKINPLKVETEVDSWNIIPELDHKTLISLTLNRWITDSSKIKWFIINGCKYLLEE